MECGQSFISSWPEKWRLFANLNYSVCHREMQLLTFLTSPCGILISVSLLPSFYTTMSQWCLSWLLCKAAADWESKALHFFFRQWQPYIILAEIGGKTPAYFNRLRIHPGWNIKTYFKAQSSWRASGRWGGMSLPNPSLVHLSGILHNVRVSA